MSLLIEDLKKSYNEPDGSVLPILSIKRFEIAKGEQVALIGSSGTGKTTLLNVISGITSADAGRVVIDTHEIVRMSEIVRDRFRAEKIGVVFQTFNLLPAFSALENVMLGMAFAGRSGGKKHATDLLDQVGLSHRLSHKPSQLSVGEQQRVAVARSLANKPSLLLADEPTANIDMANQDTVLQLIRTACSENSVSLLMVTHSQDVASQFDRVETLSDFNKPGETE